jgi:hypothetical protein
MALDMTGALETVYPRYVAELLRLVHLSAIHDKVLGLRCPVLLGSGLLPMIEVRHLASFHFFQNRFKALSNAGFG